MFPPLNVCCRSLVFLWNTPMFLNGMIILLKTVESVNVKTEEILVVKLCELGCCTFGSKYFRVQLGVNTILLLFLSLPPTDFSCSASQRQKYKHNHIWTLFLFIDSQWWFPSFFCLSYNYTDLELFKCFLFSWLTFISEQ